MHIRTTAATHLSQASYRRIRTLIVDHEPVALEQFRSLALEAPDLEVIGEARDGQQALHAILRHAPDLVFIDVQIPKPDAFDITTAVGVDRMPPVVLVSTGGQQAVRAFEIRAFDYLLKPIDRRRFHATLSRARQHIGHRERCVLGRTMTTLVRNMFAAGPAEPPHTVPADRLADRVVVQSGDRLFFVRLSDIDAVESVGECVRLQTEGQSHLLRETMNVFEARLRPDTFVRIHRSYIVNMEHVVELRTTGSGEYAVILRNGSALPISRRYRVTLQQRFGAPLSALHFSAARSR